MIQVITFSYNRAIMLDTLIRSFIDKWKGQISSFDVVYNYSTPFFGEGYERIIREYKDKGVFFYKEDNQCPDKIRLSQLLVMDNFVRYSRNSSLRCVKTNFRSLLLRILSESKAENVMFLTDDDIFISDVLITQDILKWINNKPRDRQFSLRLGRGMKGLPEKVKCDKNICEWNMYDNKGCGHWGYPFTVDAHIYNKAFVIGLLKKYIFSNPNTLEMYLVGSVMRRRQLGQGRCFENIKMLNFPINTVQDCIDNVSQGVTPEMLNSHYLKGEKLEYIIPEEYDPVDQYVNEIKFINEEGNENIVRVDSSLVRPNEFVSKK